MRILRISLYFTLLLLLTATTSAKIVFRGSQDGMAKIYVMDDDGGNIKQISNSPYSDWRPRWSPNGRRIAFVRDLTPDDSKVNPKVFIMHADGTHAQQLSDKDNYILDMAFSPDGKKIVYSTTLIGLNTIDIDTRQPETILFSHATDLDWAPDGNRIVYINDDHHIIEKNLWMVDVHGFNPCAWTHPDPDKGTMHRLHPRWSPDGRHMLYTEMDIVVNRIDREDGGFGLQIRAVGTFRYVIQNIRDGTTQTLNIPENWYPSSVAWMDEDRSVLFSAYEYNRENNRPITTKIYKYDIASEKIIYLTEGSDAHWNGGALSVFPAGKQSVRWAELKKVYSSE